VSRIPSSSFGPHFLRNVHKGVLLWTVLSLFLRTSVKHFLLISCDCPPYTAIHCVFCALGVWSFVWTLVLSFFFFFSCSLVGCFSFIYLFIYLLIYFLFQFFWLVCYNRHSQNAMHNRYFCLLVLLIRKRLCIDVRFGHIILVSTGPNLWATFEVLLCVKWACFV
jgi:hypothetical protein